MCSRNVGDNNDEEGIALALAHHIPVSGILL